MENDIEKPISSEKADLEKKIIEAKRKIKELQELTAPYPEIVSLSSDEGLNDNHYHIFQSSLALRMWEELLESYEDKLENLE